jgi:hypothetical protein
MEKGEAWHRSIYIGTFPVLRSISADRARRRCFFREKKRLRSLVDSRLECGRRAEVE